RLRQRGHHRAAERVCHRLPTGMSMRRRAGFLIVVTLAVLAWAAPTGASTTAADSGPATQVLTGLTAKYYGYLTPVVVIQRGGSITYTNLHLQRPDVVQAGKTE